jgi:hypothetical protein
MYVGVADVVEIADSLSVMAGVVNNDGRITIGVGTGSTTPSLRLYADTLLSGTGEFILGPGHNASGFGIITSFSSSPMRLEIGASSVVRGSGYVTTQASRPMMEVVNRGLLRAEGVQGIGVGPAIFDNAAGRIQVADGSVFSTNGGSTRVSGGVIESLGYATLGPYSGGSGTIAGVTLVGNFGARNQRLEDIVVVDRLETIANGSSTVVSGQWQVLGDLIVNGGERASIGGDLSLDGSGTTWLTEGSSGELAELVGSGALAIEAAHTLRGQGRLQADSGGVNQGVVMAEGGVLDIRTGAFDSTGGVLHAAHDGTMAFYSNAELMLSDASTIAIDVAGHAPGSDFGLITTLDGDIVLDGQVHFAFGSFAAAVGDEFTFFLHDHRVTGLFDGITNDRGYEMGLRYDATAVTAYIHAVPEPATWALWLAGLALTGSAARRVGSRRGS